MTAFGHALRAIVAIVEADADDRQHEDEVIVGQGLLLRILHVLQRFHVNVVGCRIPLGDLRAELVPRDFRSGQLALKGGGADPRPGSPWRPGPVEVLVAVPCGDSSLICRCRETVWGVAAAARSGGRSAFFIQSAGVQATWCDARLVLRSGCVDSPTACLGTQLLQISATKDLDDGDPVETRPAVSRVALQAAASHRARRLLRHGPPERLPGLFHDQLGAPRTRPQRPSWSLVSRVRNA